MICCGVCPGWVASRRGADRGWEDSTEAACWLQPLAVRVGNHQTSRRAVCGKTCSRTIRRFCQENSPQFNFGSRSGPISVLGTFTLLRSPRAPRTACSGYCSLIADPTRVPPVVCMLTDYRSLVEFPPTRRKIEHSARLNPCMIEHSAWKPSVWR